MNNFDDIFEPAPQNDEFDKEAWAEKKKIEREEVYNLVDTTATGICNKEENFRDYLDVQSRFHRYSATNALLIYAQNRKAEKIGDKDFWRDQGVYVKKQEFGHPIKIVESNGEYTRDDGSIGISYNIKRVYDISQTTFRARAQSPVPYDQRALLNALIYRRLVPVQSVDKLPKEAGALYDHKQKVVFVRRGMAATELFCELSRALAHAELATLDESYSNKDIDFKARCVSYILGKKFGVDVSGYNFSDIPNSLCKADPHIIRAELSDVRDIAANLSGRMERSLEQNKESRNKEKER